MLQFQTAAAIAEAVVREFTEYQESDVSAFVGSLIQYCIHQAGYYRNFTNLRVDRKGMCVMHFYELLRWH